MLEVTAGIPGSALGGADAGTQERRRLLRNFWHSARGFWGRRGARVAWLLSAAILLIVLLNLTASYGMNVWHRVIFDGLQAKDADTVLLLAMLYAPLLAGSVLLSVMQVCARMTMQRRWRRWLNNLLVDRWLRNGRHYQLELAGSAHKNPEYRIADDVRIATEAPIDFAIGVTTAVLSAATFIAVLWTIGGALTVEIGGTAVTIPGFLVVAAAIYAAAASGTMVAIGRRLIAVSENKNQAEAEYRYLLTRVREHGEGIALLEGEDEERRGVDKSFRTVLRAWRDVCIQSMRTTIVSQTSGYIAPILPIILCAPKFLDGTMTLGEVMQAASAFAIVQSALNWLVENYPRLADWAASARRVAALEVSLDALERAEIRRVGRISRGEGEDAALRLRNVAIMHNDGTAVVDGADVAIMPSEKVLLTGESGTGKSTLARTLAGVWPWGKGDIEIQAGAKLLVFAAAALCADGHASPGGELSACAPAPKRGRDRGGPGESRARPPRRAPRRGKAVGSNPLGRRETAPVVRAHLPPSPGYHRARRGHRRPRRGEPGSTDGAPVAGVRGSDRGEHRPSAGTRPLSPPQDRSQARPRGCAARCLSPSEAPCAIDVCCIGGMPTQSRCWTSDGARGRYSVSLGFARERMSRRSGTQLTSK
jgi:ABC-type uncharacterized transport system fused permease/ATPase subunit